MLVRLDVHRACLELVYAQLLVCRVVAQAAQEAAPDRPLRLAELRGPEALACRSKRRVAVEQPVHGLVQQRVRRLRPGQAARQREQAESDSAEHTALGQGREQAVCEQQRAQGLLCGRQRDTRIQRGVKEAGGVCGAAVVAGVGCHASCAAGRRLGDSPATGRVLQEEGQPRERGALRGPVRKAEQEDALRGEER